MKPLKRAVRRGLNRLGFVVWNRNQPHVYAEDGLCTHHNFSFVEDAEFRDAYARAIRANDGHDHRMRWRAHVALWAAGQAARMPGAFVECGVSTGFLMSAIMQRLGWNALGKEAFLFDTFGGLDPQHVTEKESGRLEWYSGLDENKVRENFAEFERVNFVVGTVPETLDRVAIDRVAYLSLDMNCVGPEVAALRHFWPKLVPGGWLVLDDFAYSGYEDQNRAHKALAREFGFEIVALPTGQGLAQKPPLAP